MGKLILIEGTDCSGKETQSKKLIERLNENGYKAIYYSFPNYDTPTGKIIGGPYLGKEYICKSYFEEGATNVNAKVASLYYAADRLYNINDIYKLLEEDYIIILDRYIVSNMAHQGGKILDNKKRNEMYEFIEELEYELLGLPKPDETILLHMPYSFACELKKNRNNDTLDDHEKDVEHLKNAEKSYLELKDKYNFKYINCTKNNGIRTIIDINDELYNYVINLLWE